MAPTVDHWFSTHQILEQVAEKGQAVHWPQRGDTRVKSEWLGLVGQQGPLDLPRVYQISLQIHCPYKVLRRVNQDDLHVWPPTSQVCLHILSCIPPHAHCLWSPGLWYSSHIDRQPTYAVKKILSSHHRAGKLEYWVQCWVLAYDTLDPLLLQDSHAKHSEKPGYHPKWAPRGRVAGGGGVGGLSHRQQSLFWTTVPRTDHSLQTWPPWTPVPNRHHKLWQVHSRHHTDHTPGLNSFITHSLYRRKVSTVRLKLSSSMLPSLVFIIVYLVIDLIPDHVLHLFALLLIKNCFKHNCTCLRLPSAWQH